jgi:hypothetical protein
MEVKMEKAKELIVGMEFKSRRQLCSFLGESLTVSIPNQLEKWSRYFKWDKKKGTHKFIITGVYDAPKSSLDDGFYKTIIIPVKCNKTDYGYLQQCNKWSAEVWNYLVKLDRENDEKFGVLLSRSELQDAVKGYTPMHSQGNQHVYIKYYTSRQANINSIRAKHKNSGRVKLPYREKKYFNTAWNKASFSFDYDNGIIKLSRARDDSNRRNQIYCYAKTIPKNIVEIELVYRNGLKLAIKYRAVNDKSRLNPTIPPPLIWVKFMQLHP